MAIKRSLLLAACLMSSSVAPAYALRCGTSLVLEGQSKYEVLQRCGQPSYTDAHMEYRRALPNAFPSAPVDSENFGAGFPAVREVRVEEWVYDFGSTRFMQSLIFENGRLMRIRNLGYGQ